MPLNPPQDFRGTDKTHRIGISIDRPEPADVLPGTLYFSTDTVTLERSNGVIWEPFGVPGQALLLDFFDVENPYGEQNEFGIPIASPYP